MEYTLVNPSDAICFETDNESALMAGVLMSTGSGMISLNRVPESKGRLPMIAFMSKEQLSEWEQECFGGPLGDYIAGHKAEIAAALGSFLYGSPGERKLFAEAVKNEPDPIAFKSKWNDDRRTSMSDYGKAFTRTIDRLTKEAPDESNG